MAVAVVLTWLTFGFADHALHTWAGWARRQENPAPAAWGWRFGMRPVRRVARCAHLASTVMPAGSRVLVHGADGSVEEWRWFAFLLHRHDVVHESSPGTQPTYLLTLDRKAPVRGNLVAARGPCALYRLR
jgi:hypothetical protein